MSDDDHLLVHALADGEVDAPTALTLERRLAAEPDLKADYERILALKSAMGRLEKPAVTDAFQSRIAALATPKAAAEKADTPPRRNVFQLSDWRAMAASLVLTAGLASGLTYTIMAPTTATDAMMDGIVSGHRRSLLASSPIDVASSDRHTVRPWFDAKLGVSPPTPDLASAGYTLVGGRIDVLNGRAVPTLVYRRNGHMITVVTMPDPPGADRSGTNASAPPVGRTMAGYNVVHWRREGFRYWAVSDMDMSGLKAFAAMMRKA